MASFCVLVLLVEIAHRVRHNRSKLQIDTPKVDEQNKGQVQNGMKIYSPEAVERAVADGGSLLVFDNLVLDLDKSLVPLVSYTKVHPGGKFVLMKNFGRDISKFFYGGYALVNPGMPAVTHSLYALRIAKTLVVGVLED